MIAATAEKGTSRPVGKANAAVTPPLGNSDT
jgi:hypothetical protein